MGPNEASGASDEDSEALAGGSELVGPDSGRYPDPALPLGPTPGGGVTIEAVTWRGGRGRNKEEEKEERERKERPEGEFRERRVPPDSVEV